VRRRELDGRTVQRCARVAADSVEQAKLEAGDLVGAVAEGLLTWDAVVEFADILAGKVAGRDRPDDITLFESQGISVWDVAAAARVYALAQARGLGQPIPLFDYD
jgi:ornithine cyclodeaminase/alanine dehydrogenase-like protein (mu-crystallin family)